MLNGSAYSLGDYVEDLRRITSETDNEDEIIRKLGPLAQRLAADRSWLEEKHYDADPDQGFGVHLLHEEADHTLAVFVISWLSGRGVPPHDHGTWAVVSGVEGVERNVRYKRSDDGSRPDIAELSTKHVFDVGEGELICIKTGGIHSVINNSDRTTLSLHTYGKHINHTNRSQFDLETNTRKNIILRID